MPSADTSSFWFALGRSRAIEGEPDGFSSVDLDALPEDEARWVDVERRRALILARIPREVLAEAMDAAPDRVHVTFDLAFLQDRWRPCLYVDVDGFARLPKEQHLDFIGAQIGLLGAREWVRWTTTETLVPHSAEAAASGPEMPGP